MRLLRVIPLVLLAACAEFNPPPPSSCAAWSRAAEAKLTASGVDARVLGIRLEKLGHEVCIFEHSDMHLWVYDPATDEGYGNFGGSHRIGTDRWDANWQAAWLYGKTATGKFL